MFTRKNHLVFLPIENGCVRIGNIVGKMVVVPFGKRILMAQLQSCC